MRHPAWTAALAVAAWTALCGIVAAEEVTSSVTRYRNYEYSTGFYEQYEVRPSRNRSFVTGLSQPGRGPRYGPSASSLHFPTRMADSHAGVMFYEGRTCADCHQRQAANNLHVTRSGLTCRQCHGTEPIAGVKHYHSPLNRIRRHSYVCAKCHQDAGYSFATYVTHEPNPLDPTTASAFPGLYWAFWIMAGLAVVSLGLFLPHTLLWGLRDLLAQNHDQKPKEDGS